MNRTYISTIFMPFHLAFLGDIFTHHHFALNEKRCYNGDTANTWP